MRVLGRVAVGLAAALAWAPPARATGPSLDVSQYEHTAWTSDAALSDGDIGSIAQTSDGYLWFGTRFGVVRFDGLRSLPWRPPHGAALPDRRIRALLGTRDGSLWIGTLRGLATFTQGTLVTHDRLQGKTVNALVEDGDGTVWAGGTGGAGDQERAFLCAFRASASECHGDDGRFGRTISALYRDRRGALWVAGADQVWRWSAAAAVAFPVASGIDALQHLTGTPEGAIIAAAGNQLLTIQDDRVGQRNLDSTTRELAFNRVLSDRDGALWLAAADSGLFHVRGDRLDRFTQSEGLSGDYVTALFEDREGNVWTATTSGIDRFRPPAAVMHSRAQGVRGRVVSVLSASDGAVWASSTAGLYRLTGGRVEMVRPGPAVTLFEDRRGRIWSATDHELGYLEDDRFVALHGVPPGYIDGLTGDADGNVWIVHRAAGIFRLRLDGSVEHTPWPDLDEAPGGRPDAVSGQVSAATTDPTDGSLWVGRVSGRVTNVSHGKVRRLLGAPAPDELGRIRHIGIDADGTFWLSARTGLHRVRDGRTVRLDSTNGLPCDRMYSTTANDRFLWLYMECGLVQLARRDLDTWAEPHGPAPASAVRVTHYWDGLRYMKTSSIGSRIADVSFMNPKADVASDGRVWLATQDGVAVVDPARMPFNRVPPPVVVQQIVSDGTTYERRPDLRLPPRQRNLEIEYAGLSLTAPEKVQFRYRLDGRDTAWQDAGNRRRAFYTDLPPGRYRFHVIAANNSGVWNEQGDAIEFSIAPAWWQTPLFRVGVAAVIALLLFGLYRLRVERLSREFSSALDARVNERLRISRELHDTLLQSFQGSLLKFHAAASLLPAQPAVAKRRLEDVILQAEQAIVEGRDTVRGLRSSTVTTSDLADDLLALRDEATVDGTSGLVPELRVEVDGAPRDLVPLVRDEVQRIAGEAVRNAFRHSGARRVAVCIRYGPRRFELTVFDDGKGIGADVLAKGGRAGHYGLRGMEERAHVAGGTLALKTEINRGTEVTLAIAASRAYLRARDAAKKPTLAT